MIVSKKPVSLVSEEFLCLSVCFHLLEQCYMPAPFLSVSQHHIHFSSLEQNYIPDFSLSLSLLSQCRSRVTRQLSFTLPLSLHLTTTCSLCTWSFCFLSLSLSWLRSCSSWMPTSVPPDASWPRTTASPWKPAPSSAPPSWNCPLTRFEETRSRF